MCIDYTSTNFQIIPMHTFEVYKYGTSGHKSRKYIPAN